MAGMEARSTKKSRLVGRPSLAAFILLVLFLFPF